MSSVQHRKLPIGIQTFSDIREGGYYYVDKTPFIEKLVNQNKYYFLSRPRRFGKSLLLDTLRCLFEGRQSLFEGLHIHDDWDWQQTYPVIRLSFGDGMLTSRDALDIHTHELLNAQAEAQGVSLRNTSIAGRFRELIHQTHRRHGQRAVVLIDEYDKPILDNILAHERARELREGLKNLYSVIKDADPHLHLVLITGVSKFSKVSLFSGLNNLRDITLSSDYATICGYTDHDIDTVFAPALADLDREEIRRWYNGYHWGGQEAPSVYNPFDVLLLLEEREFGPYWFESATPTFLVNLLKERGIFTPALTAWHSRPALLSRFDVDDIATDALLFQTGYLTLQGVHEEVPHRPLYKLGLPNLEVEISLNEALLPILGLSHHTFDELVFRLPRLLKAADMAGLEAHMKSLYAGLPHDWYRNNPIAQYEGHYASVFYSHFAALGVGVIVEDASHKGKVDMTVDFGGQLYLFEFKVVEQEPQGKALEQIKAKGYADKYLARGKPIHLVGIEFSSTERQITAFDVETLAP
ncbi:AAA family ATPase [Halomonas sp. TBZ9]|uniref:AAA family ATPase n=1 Tax=Vreelandella azerica TaxID=2732867 RepID=A0A7Y3X9H4_9GAMM|nr:AAA family ATPase [Halomonas azerica]NOG31707.1 AAA family ATPase [Halomonas azerica]